MDVRLIPYKVKNRLNKLDSADYDDLQCHQIVEAYNKAQLEWSRRKLSHEGLETILTNVDDLQILLTPVELLGSNRDYYFLSKPIPENYLTYNLLRVYASKKNCAHKRLKSHLREEANAEDLLRDRNSRPDFSWRETFHTFVGNHLKVYTNSDFAVDKVELTYYRQPREIRIAGCDYLGESSAANIDPEFKDDVVELIINEAAAILAGDIESINQIQINSQRSQLNN